MKYAIFLIFTTLFKSTLASALVSYQPGFQRAKIQSKSLNQFSYKDVISSSTTNVPKDWHHLDLNTDGFLGISSDKAYKFFPLPKVKSFKDVIVAVIDTGVDVNHIDLKGKIWTNDDEIPDNGIDDDGNGYIDDFMGWNFIGSSKYSAQFEKNGDSYKLIQAPSQAHLIYDSLVYTREYASLLSRYNAGELLTESDQVSFEYLEEQINEQRNTLEKKVTEIKRTIKIMTFAQNTLIDAGIEDLTKTSLLNYVPNTPKEKYAQKALLDLLNQGQSMEYLRQTLNSYQIHFTHYLDLNNEARMNIVGDNIHNIDDRYYGNNDVIGPSPDHGTHVAGIIAAQRYNNLGIRGIADFVKIMPIKILPDGDERDKDVVNAIRYAVDNGARIINLSFSKTASLNKDAVSLALKYAAENNVLVVHSAGNESINLDKVGSYPTPLYYENQKKTMHKNFIEVAASFYYKDLNIAAQFSNFGKETVDLFAPGVNIFSLVSNDDFSPHSGTSMSAPIISGMAAVLLTHNPNLSAVKVKRYIMRSTKKITNLKITKHGAGKVYFSQLSKRGGVPNLYLALKKLYRDMDVMRVSTRVETQDPQEDFQI